jgi:hypothetical protein
MPIQSLYLQLFRLVAIALGALNIAALGVGILRPAHPALSGLNAGCPQQSKPCWYGIVPGETTVEEARKILEWDATALMGISATGTLSRVVNNIPGVCMAVVEITDNIITWIKMEYCPDAPVRIGEVIAVVGFPQRIMGGRRELGFGGVNTSSYAWWSPFDYTRGIGLHVNDLKPQTITWHGFIPKWRYCQMKIGTPGCIA